MDILQNAVQKIEKRAFRIAYLKYKKKIHNFKLKITQLNFEIAQLKLVKSDNSPKVDPPKEDPPKEDPPKEDPPKEDSPKEDPPKKDQPKIKKKRPVEKESNISRKKPNLNKDQNQKKKQLKNEKPSLKPSEKPQTGNQMKRKNKDEKTISKKLKKNTDNINPMEIENQIEIKSKDEEIEQPEIENEILYDRIKKQKDTTKEIKLRADKETENLLKQKQIKVKKSKSEVDKPKDKEIEHLLKQKQIESEQIEIENEQIEQTQWLTEIWIRESPHYHLLNTEQNQTDIRIKEYLKNKAENGKLTEIYCTKKQYYNLMQSNMTIFNENCEQPHNWFILIKDEEPLQCYKCGIKNNIQFLLLCNACLKLACKYHAENLNFCKRPKVIYLHQMPDGVFLIY